MTAAVQDRPSLRQWLLTDAPASRRQARFGRLYSDWLALRRNPLAMAGLGPDRTMIDIWADPAVDRNIHRIEVEADAARFSFQIENVPSLENPKTGRMTPLSVIALLKKLTSPLAIGT